MTSRSSPLSHLTDFFTLSRRGSYTVSPPSGGKVAKKKTSKDSFRELEEESSEVVLKSNSLPGPRVEVDKENVSSSVEPSAPLENSCGQETREGQPSEVAKSAIWGKYRTSPSLITDCDTPGRNHSIQGVTAEPLGPQGN